jgi:SAM-dependent methyltransferase
VLDIGAGTGILSLFAAQAGASRVYAVEQSPIVKIMQAIVKDNGVADRISIVRSDIDRASLPCKVDVIVFEWLGTMGVDENMLPLVVRARDRWLKPGGRVLPERVTAWIAPVWSDEMSAEREWESGRPYGLDFRALMDDRPKAELFNSWRMLDAADMPVEPATLWTTDVPTIGSGAASRAFRAALTCTARQEGRINAFATWFDAHLGGGIHLSTAPTAPKTHWGHYLFPLRAPRQIASSATINLKFACIPAGPGRCRFEWSMRGDDGRWEHHRAG